MVVDRTTYVVQEREMSSIPITASASSASSNRKTLLSAVDRFNARRSIFLPLLFILFLFLLFRWSPFDIYWNLAFRTLRLYVWWPLLFFPLLLLFPLAGWWTHRKEGAMQHFP